MSAEAQAVVAILGSWVSVEEGVAVVVRAAWAVLAVWGLRLFDFELLTPGSLIEEELKEVLSVSFQENAHHLDLILALY